MKEMIGRYMVKGPYTVDSDMDLKSAQDLMHECAVRHLPITEKGKLVGIVSDRDVSVALTLPQARQLTLADIMKTDVYAVSRTASLRDIVLDMREQKIGSVVVVNNEMECVGIFTTIDALDILADFLDDDDEGLRSYNFDDYIERWGNVASIR